MDSLLNREMIVTGFPSWMGEADPGSVFGPAFASELGNRLHFPVHIERGLTGPQFSISMLSFQATNPLVPELDFSWAAGAYNYSAGWVGLNWGLNGVRGGGDDTWITSGVNTQLADEIFGRGSGNGYAAYCTGCTVEQQQAQIDAARAHPGQNYTFTARYTITLSASDLASGETTVQITETPEPAGWVMMGLGIVGLWWLRRLDASRG